MSSYAEGRAARREGLPKTANPYPAHTPMWRMWNEGWQDSDGVLRDLASSGPAARHADER